jgi:hypothetical protein
MKRQFLVTIEQAPDKSHFVASIEEPNLMASGGTISAAVYNLFDDIEDLAKGPLPLIGSEGITDPPYKTEEV